MRTGHSAPRRVRALLVASSGGHLMQLHALEPWWSRHDRLWVSFNSSHARSLLVGEEVVYAFAPTTRNIPNLLRNTQLAAQVLWRYRPDVVVTTGAGVGLPFIVLGRLLGAMTVFIEVYDRITMPTLTGQMARPFTNVVLVQWKDQLRAYPEAVLVGPLL